MKRLLLNSTILALFSGFTANAADMSYPVGEQTTPVEFGSGWYLRGDIGYNIGGKQERGGRFVDAVGSFVTTDYDDALAIRAGFGYQLNSSFRLEMDVESNLESNFANTVAIGYSGSYGFTNGAGAADTVFFNAFGVVTGTASGTPFAGTVGPIIGSQVITASYASQNIMAHGYYDFAKIGNFTPYVGAGAGLARLTYSEKRVNSACTSSTYACTGQVSSQAVDYTDTAWKFAYSLSAGTAYALNDNLSLDVGYSYLNVGGGEKLEYSDGSAMDMDGYATHQVRAGLRYQIW